MTKIRKRTRFSEALAHLKHLISLGAEYPDAVYSTSVAFEMNVFEVDLLEQNYMMECAEDTYDYE